MWAGHLPAPRRPLLEPEPWWAGGQPRPTGRKEGGRLSPGQLARERTAAPGPPCRTTEAPWKQLNKHSAAAMVCFPFALQTCEQRSQGRSAVPRPLPGSSSEPAPPEAFTEAAASRGSEPPQLSKPPSSLPPSCSRTCGRGAGSHSSGADTLRVRSEAGQGWGLHPHKCPGFPATPSSPALPSPSSAQARRTLRFSLTPSPLHVPLPKKDLEGAQLLEVVEETSAGTMAG